MGHEFVHVSQFASLAGMTKDKFSELWGKGFESLMEYHAYSYGSTIGKPFNGTNFNVHELEKIFGYDLFVQMHYFNYPWIHTVVKPF